MSALSGRYQRRLVASSDARACVICYRLTTTVLVNEVPSADHFYICESHLGDSSFAKPDPSSATAVSTTTPDTPPPVPAKPEIEKEIAKLREQWNAVKQKSDEKTSENEKETGQKKGTPNPITDPVKDKTTEPAPESDPISRVRWFQLNQGILNLRRQNRRRILQSKKTSQMLSNPSLFPMVPVHVPGQMQQQKPSIGPGPATDSGTSTDSP